MRHLCCARPGETLLLIFPETSMKKICPNNGVVLLGFSVVSLSSPGLNVRFWVCSGMGMAWTDSRFLELFWRNTSLKWHSPQYSSRWICLNNYDYLFPLVYDTCARKNVLSAFNRVLSHSAVNKLIQLCLWSQNLLIFVVLNGIEMYATHGKTHALLTFKVTVNVRSGHLLLWT